MSNEKGEISFVGPGFNLHLHRRGGRACPLFQLFSYRDERQQAYDNKSLAGMAEGPVPFFSYFYTATRDNKRTTTRAWPEWQKGLSPFSAIFIPRRETTSVRQQEPGRNGGRACPLFQLIIRRRPRKVRHKLNKWHLHERVTRNSDSAFQAIRRKLRNICPRSDRPLRD